MEASSSVGVLLAGGRSGLRYLLNFPRFKPIASIILVSS